MSFGLKKLLGKAASVGAALAMTVSLVPANAGLGSIPASAEDTVTVYNWNDLKTNLKGTNKVVKLGSDISATSAYEIKKTYSVTLDLNGKTINRGMSEATTTGQVFINFGTFTITDSVGTGKITGAWHKSVGAIKNGSSGVLTLAGGAITGNKAGSGGNADGGGINNDGTFIMTGGSITNNTAVRGGGIFNDANASGKVYIKGGTIANNQALTGAGIYNQYELHISGGTISGNIATGDAYGNKNGGVDSSLDSSTTYISGNPVITGNLGGGSTVNLVSKNKINIEAALTTGAKIGYYGTAAGVFTNGWGSKMGSSAAPSSFFTSDNTSFSVTRSNNEASLGTGGGGGETTEYYTVTFNANGGLGKMDDRIASSDSLFVLPECQFTPPSGKSFDKWDIGTGAPGSSVKITKDTTIKAIWKGASVSYCTVNFNANGGSGSMISDTVVSGSSYTLPACEFNAPSGKSFAGWKVGSTVYNAGDTITASGSSVTAYAQWSDATCTVNFIANGGSGSMNSVNVTKGSQYTLPACTFTAPVGKVFNGWDKGAVGSKITVNANTTLTAQWKTIECTVSFAANGGSGTMNAVKVNYGSSYSLPACTFTAPTGKTFNGWDKGAAGTSITVTSNITLKAQWKAIPCTVTFAANGGSGTMNKVTVDYGSSYTLPVCTFVAPSGKVFDKWDKGTTGSNITVTGNITLTAQWKTGSSTVLKGDVDGNSRLNMKDLANLQRYINGWTDVTVVFANADMDNSGKLNMRDVAALQVLLNSV